MSLGVFGMESRFAVPNIAGARSVPRRSSVAPSRCASERRLSTADIDLCAREPAARSEAFPRSSRDDDRELPAAALAIAPVGVEARGLGERVAAHVVDVRL